MSRDQSDSLMDAIFSAVQLPAVGNGTTVYESHSEESHSYSKTVTVGGVVSHSTEVGHQVEHQTGHQAGHQAFEADDNRSEVSGVSRATSVSVHSSVSQKSAQHYDFPPSAQYDVPPIVVGGVVASKRSSVASSKSSSKHSVATHDSESTISESTIVGEKVHVGGVVTAPLTTPVAVPKTAEHDAVLEQFKNLHGKEPSIVSSVVPASIHVESDSEDSIAPSKLTASIITGGNTFNVLQRSSELPYSDFIAPVYQAASINGHFDTRSVDSFGFEHVEYVDSKSEAPSEVYYHDKAHAAVPEDNFKQVEQPVIEQQQTYEPYHSVYTHHETPTINFEEHHEEQHHHEHHEDHHHVETHTYTHVTQHSGGKQSRSNTESTYHNVFAQHSGPKITEELRSAIVYEEDETHVEPPVLAYVAPIPVKPPRVHSHDNIYDPYSFTNTQHHNLHHQNDLVKSTTVVYEDVRTGPGRENDWHSDSSSSIDIVGVHELRKKFENGVPPPLSPVFEVEKLKHSEGDHHEHHHHHHHHHHHQHQEHHHQVEEEHKVQVGQHINSTASYVSVDDTHHYDVPFESHPKSSPPPSQMIIVRETQTQISNHQYDHNYDTPASLDRFQLHSPAFYNDDQHHHYIPQIKVITEYRHIDPRHHYVEKRLTKSTDGGHVVSSPMISSVDYFKDIDRSHNFVPSTPTSPVKDVRQIFREHSYVPSNTFDYNIRTRESRSIERSHHYIPEEVKREQNKKIDFTKHSYIPLEVRSKSEESRHRKTNWEHSYVPLVPAHQDAHAKSQILRSHHYIPPKSESAEATHKSNIIHENQYVPLAPKHETHHQSVEKHHSYIPLAVEERKVENTVVRDHNYVPLVTKSTTVSLDQNHQHHYLPLAASSTKKSDDKEVISKHNYVPLTAKTEQVPRHANEISHHHQYMPLTAQPKTVDKVIREHQYLPLAPKTEHQQTAVAKDHHNYLPLITTSTVEKKSIERNHRFIPLPGQINKQQQDSKNSEMPRNHGYIPLVIPNETVEQLDMEHHHYIPPMESKQQHHQKAGINLNEHHYYPLAKTGNASVRQKNFDEHHYIPLVQSAQLQNPKGRIISDHQYYPLAPKAAAIPHLSHNVHQYVPPVRQQESTKGIQSEIVRNHNYVPLVQQQKDEKVIIQEHHYLPAVTKKEAAANVERTHNYVPYFKGEKPISREPINSHTFVPKIVPRTSKAVSEVNRDHSFVPPVNSTNTSHLTSDVIASHSYVPPVPPNSRNDKNAHSTLHHSYIPRLPNKKQQEVVTREHSYLPAVQKVDQSQSKSAAAMEYKHGYVPVVASKKEDAEETIGQTHHYVPVLPNKALSEGNNDRHAHHYVPALQSKKEAGHIERSHHYVPPSERHSESREVDIHHHHFVPAIPSHQTKLTADHEKHHYYPTIAKKEASSQIIRSHNYVPTLEANQQQVKAQDLEHHHYVPALPTPALKDTSEVKESHHYVPTITKQERSSTIIRDHHFVPKFEQADQPSRNDVEHHHFVPTVEKKSSSLQHHKEALENHHYVPTVNGPAPKDVADIETHHYVPTFARKNPAATFNREHHFVPKLEKNDGSRSTFENKHSFVPTLPPKDEAPIAEHDHHFVPTLPVKEVPQDLIRSHHFVPTTAAETKTKPKNHIEDYEKHHYVPALKNSYQIYSSENRNFSSHKYVPQVQKPVENTHPAERSHSFMPELPRKEETTHVQQSHNFVPVPFKSGNSQDYHGFERKHHYSPIIDAKTADAHVNISEHHFIPTVEKNLEAKTEVIHHHNFVPQLEKRQESTVHQNLNHHYLPTSPPKGIAQQFDSKHHYIPVVKKDESTENFDRSHHYVPLVDYNNHHQQTRSGVAPQNGKILLKSAQLQSQIGKLRNRNEDSEIEVKKPKTTNDARQFPRQRPPLHEIFTDSPVVYSNAALKPLKTIPDEPTSYMLKNKRSKAVHPIVIPNEPADIPVPKPRSFTSPQPAN